MVIKEIKDKEELNKWMGEVNSHPFSSNKVIYNNALHYYINNTLYNTKEVYTGAFSEDCLHQGHFVINSSENIIKIYSGIDLRDRGKYDPRNSDSWVRVDFAKTDVTADEEQAKKIYQVIFTKRTGEMFTKLSEEELTDWGFIRGTVNPGYWFYKSELKFLDTTLAYRKFDNTYNNVDIKNLPKAYLGESPETIRELTTKALKDNIKFGTDSLTYKVFEGIKYTFGIEIETCVGRLDAKDYKHLNLKAVHDGSLRDANGETPGGEYVTGVLKGDAGMAQLYETCRVLANKCKVNHQCGVHVHVGSLNWNKDDVVYAYLLGELLEKELFSMLPKSRRENSYCRKLTVITAETRKQLASVNSKSEYNILIDKIYNDIFKEVTYIKGKNFIDKHQPSDTCSEEPFITSKNINRANNHPNGSKCGYDKGAQRYSWLNFVTLLYNTKNNANAYTLEFRPHSATMNYTKIKNWTKICFAFCKFVENHKALIDTLNVDLDLVISKIYPKTGQELVNYIKERKQLFSMQDESVDYIDTIPDKKTIKEVVECV